MSIHENGDDFLWQPHRRAIAQSPALAAGGHYKKYLGRPDLVPSDAHLWTEKYDNQRQSRQTMHNPNPSDIESSYKIPDQPLYLVGTFDNGVTVLSQQIRALNLVYALVEGGVIPSTHAGATPPKDFQKKIAIVGGGFTGLSVAAGLVSKGVEAEITLFEQRDTLLPLQQGSDTRWLHPHIYNWPAEGSEISAANLPLLNWTAARASDVVVQVLGQWRSLVDGPSGKRIKLYCNTRHLQIHESKDPKKLPSNGLAKQGT
ncbi:FAD-dependent oxidoreductase [Rhizobium sp. 268]|uniref:FAD-dependent oxidoreductase n=1 Tax=Rhizobium sp. 268 TaxID=2996375 RepID=UPI002F92D8BF